ncbi:monocarboxylate transporter 10-like, partial [Physella acuta]
MTAKNKKKDGGGDAKARNGGKNGKVNGKEQGKLLKDEKKQIRQRRDSEDSQVSFESVEDYIPTPPDGGWGWVIVCSSVFCNLIVDGIGYSFGVFLQEFVEYFK